MPGYAVRKDRGNTDVRPVEGGAPFEFARRAAVEDVVRLQGEIGGGDGSGRSMSNPGMADSLNARRKALEDVQETAYRPDAPPLTSDQVRVVDALVSQGESCGFIDMLEDETASTVQAWIDGKATLDDVLRVARDESNDDMVQVLVGMGIEAPVSTGP